MKKLNIFLMGALVMGLASCDDKSDLGIMQTNPQLPEYEVGDFSISLAPDIVNGIDLNTYSGATIPVIVVNSPIGNLPEGAYVEYEMLLSDTDDPSKSEILPITDNAVSKEAWEEVCTAFYGVDPSPRMMKVGIGVYVWDGKQQNRIGSWYCEQEIKVTPLDAKLDVESKYYLVYGNNIIEFGHSDTHVYIDPNFSVEIELEDADLPATWTIRSESGRTYGVTEGTAPNTLKGDLVENGAAGTINDPGTYTWNVNMLDLTYNIASVSIVVDFDYLYTPGEGNAWSQANSQMLFTNDKDNFQGFAYIDAKFKFTSALDWDHYNFGAGPEAGQLSVDPSASDLTVAEKGLYYCNVVISSMSYTTTLIDTIGIIGTATPGGWDASSALTSTDYLVWSGDIYLTAGEYKFRCNDDWAVNLGGNATDLSFGGDNLMFDGEDGTYTVTLDLSKLPYTCTVTAK